MTEPFIIRGDTSLVLSANTMAAVLDGLAEIAFKRAQPAIEEIMSQMRAREAGQAPGLPTLTDIVNGELNGN